MRKFLFFLCGFSVLLGSVSLSQAQFQTVIVESKLADGSTNVHPPYLESGPWFNSTAKSAAPGLSGSGSRYTATNVATVKITPALTVSGGTYSVEVTQNGPSSQSGDILASITQVGCSGLPTNTIAFQRNNPNQWKLVGNITLNPGVTQPEITFGYISGALNFTNGRFYSDAVRFVQQEQVIIESRLDGGVLNTNTGSGYTELTGNWQNSSAKSSASGVTGVGARFASTNVPAFKVQPTLGQAGGLYSVEVTQNGPASQSADITIGITQTGCAGLPSTTDAFRRDGANLWKSVGTIALDPGVTQPEITFTYAGGTLNTTNGRFYSDSIRFRRLNLPPAFTRQPITQSIPLGSSTTFSVEASGAPTIFYQWQFNGTNINGATQSSLTLVNVQTNAVGSYSVVASNAFGAVTSLAVPLILLTPPTIITEPQSQTVASGSEASFTVAAIGNPSPSYQWVFKGSSIVGATQSIYQINPVQPINSGGYQVIVSNSLGTVTSQTALLNVTSLEHLFADDFEVDSSSAWTINRSSSDTRITFSYDYSNFGIPPAPHSSGGTTRGIKFEVNMTNGAKAAVSISPTGKQFSGDYKLHFDLWMNANGPFPGGGTGSAQHFTAGVGTAGNRVQWTGGGSTADGFWFAVDGEGNPTGNLKEALQDFAALNGTSVMPIDSGMYAAGTDASARDSSNAYYAVIFPGGQTPPLFQQTNYAQQTGALGSGTIGFKWRDVIISKEGATVAWSIDGLRIATFTNASLTANNIFLGYWDSFASLSDNVALSFGVVDNLRVEQVVTNANTVPFIAQQPSDQIVGQGSDVSFFVLAGGTAPLCYQWRQNSTNLAGATSSSLALTNVQTSQSGNYSVVVSNVASSVISSNALLTVLVPVTIVTQPQDAAVEKGAPAIFTVQATGSAPLSYQWSFNGTNFPGATASSYNLTNAQAADMGNYSVVVSNPINAVSSSNAVLKINGFPSIMTPPQRQTAPLGGSATFSVVADGYAPLFYQWKQNGVALTNDDRIVGANSATLTVNYTLISDARNYTCTVSNWVGDVTSASAILRLSSSQGVFMIESRLEGDNNVNTAPPYEEVAGNWAISVLKSLAPDVTQSVGSRFAMTTNASFKVLPALQANKSYVVQITHGIAASVSSNIVVSITQSNCAGLPPSTTAFDRSTGNVWETLGIITTFTNEPMPEITFTHSSGDPNRFYADAVRFLDASEPCLFGLPQLSSVTGPLVAGQTFVKVPGVSTNAAKITIYADGVVVGEKTNGIVAGLNSVSTTTLSKGQQIVATQTDNAGLESCQAANGSFVGGGANPRLRVSLSFRVNESLTGPIGASSGPASGNPLVMLGATHAVDGFGTAPVGGRVIEPSTCWQTVSFFRGPDPTNSIDPTYAWFAGFGTNYLLGNFAVLDAITLSIDDLTDTGPFQIYIDNIKNGDTLVQDFEGYAAGTTDVIFKKPSYALTTYPFLISGFPGTTAPNASTVSSANADTGNKSLFVTWQYGSTNSSGWVRLTAQGNIMSYPMMDMRQPISFRILLLPLGQSVGSSAQITQQPVSRTRNMNEEVSFTFSATGSSAVNYQWRFNGTNISGATASTLNLSNLQTNQSGQYSAVAQSGDCVLVSSNATLSVVIPPLGFQSITVGTDGKMLLLMSGNPSATYWVERSTNLIDWRPFTNFISTNAIFELNDPAVPNAEQGFYRVHQ